MTFRALQSNRSSIYTWVPYLSFSECKYSVIHLDLPLHLSHRALSINTSYLYINGRFSTKICESEITELQNFYLDSFFALNNLRMRH